MDQRVIISQIYYVWIVVLLMYIQNSMFPDVEIRGENLICGLSNEKRTHQQSILLQSRI